MAREQENELNNFAKISPDVWALWKSILKRLPTSRLIIKAKSLADTSLRKSIMNMFTDEGIQSDRIELLSWIQSTKEHLDVYNRIDIALDTFPYNGTTTTCEALWMGVPVVTLAGSTHVSRVGVSLLSNVGVPDLIAQTKDELTDILVNLTENPDRLQKMRKSMRIRMSQSALTDAKQFTVDLEQCYKKIWKNYYQTI